MTRRSLLFRAAVGLAIGCVAGWLTVGPRFEPDTIRHHHYPLSIPALTTTTTTTSTTIPDVVRPASSSRATVAVQRHPAAPVPSGDVWAALAQCESHGNPQAVSAGGRYWGAFQFSLTTWHSLGYGGNPVDYPYETQRTAAQQLVARSGWGQFPVCGRRVA